MRFLPSFLYLLYLYLIKNVTVTVDTVFFDYSTFWYFLLLSIFKYYNYIIIIYIYIIYNMNFRKTFFREYDSLKKTVTTVTVTFFCGEIRQKNFYLMIR